MKIHYLFVNKLKCLIVVAAAFVALTTATPRSQATEIAKSKNFGLGLVLGYPDLGFSINYFFSKTMSLQIDPILRFHRHKGHSHTWLGGRVDLLFWMPTIESFSFADLLWYFGPGANIGLRLGDNGGLGLGAEFPVGIGFRFNDVPIDLNLEAVPVLHIIDDVYFGIAGALNARYYF